VFRTRCPLAIEACARQVPPLEQIAPGHQVACHRWREV
jgi:ABC-type dipeptide/oligopeptide/nickel transport system ATPase component